NLTEAYLTGADLRQADLRQADLRRANLTEAILEEALLVETDFRGTNLTGCKVYGISAWNVHLDDRTDQKGLIITQEDEPTVTIDDLEVAQFTYLLLNNQKIRNVIDTIGKK